ncbi:MAG: TonB-dependent receptor [Flavobacteriales bacterium]
MNRNLTLLLLLASTFASAQSFTLSGTIAEQDGTPVQSANVLVDATMGASTDVIGRYSIPGIPAGEHTVVVTILGFARNEQRIKVAADMALDVQLTQAAIELREAPVTAKHGSSTTESINALDMKTRPFNNTQEMMQLVPGLFVAQHAGGGKAEQIFFRGFDCDHGTDLQVSVDGLPVNMVSHAHGQGYADLHFTIPETMDKLLVHKGPYDARFGDFATSGTVEFLTKNSIDKNEIKAEYGMFNTKRAVGLFNVLDKKHLFGKRKENAYIAAEYAFTDAYFDSKQDFGRLNIFGKYTGQVGESSQLTLSASTFSAAWNASGQVPQRAIDSGLIDRFGAIDDDEGGNTTRTNAYAILATGLRNGGLIKNQLYFVKYDFNLFSNFTFFATDSVNGDMINQTDDRVIAGYVGTYGKSTHLGALPFRINAGLGARYDGADIALKNARERVVFDTIVAGSVDQLNASAYLDGTVDVTERFSINGAARLDVFHFMYTDARGVDSVSGESTIARVSPKLNFTYTFSQRAQVYLRTGVGFHSNDARAVVVDKASRTLPRAYGADLGTTFKPLPRMLVNVAFWGLYLESELVYVGDGGVVETSDPTQRMGIDLSVRYQLTDHLFADADLNLVDGKVIGPPSGEDAIPLAPRFTTIGGLAYKRDRGFNASVRYRHIADRPANETNSVVAKGYVLLDATASYRLKSLEIGVSAENLLNSEWNQAQFDTESRLSNESDPVSELHFTPGTPFFLKGFVSVRF